ncbi:MAG: hypothetical protein QOE40_2069 [Actinomycetota bacterium]|nr:hypothetical protein [Actinomycetota bacterium]
MWRSAGTNRAQVRPAMPTPAHQDLHQLLLPRRSPTRALGSRLCFWAPTSPGSTTRAACFFQHVSAMTWLRAS